LRHSGLVHFEVNGKLFIFKIPVSGPDFQNTVELPQSRISRTPYPPIGGHAVSGTQTSVPSTLSPPKKSSNPKLKYEALEINEVGDHFERKELVHYTVILGLSESKIFTHYNCCWEPL